MNKQLEAGEVITINGIDYRVHDDSSTNWLILERVTYVKPQ